MSCTRRKFVVAGLSVFAAGCAERAARVMERPSVPWPEVSSRPVPASGRTRVARPASTARQTSAPRVVASNAGPLQAIPRSAWTNARPVPTRLNGMGGVNRITVHHEGWHAVYFTDVPSTIARLESDRRVHVEDRHWGDIGYHFIIDRSGRIWEGRELRYQGAHVRAHNEHNIGIMVLGNFDVQRPSDAQLRTLHQTLGSLMTSYRVDVGRVYTHQELMPTACPGKALQPQVTVLRRQLT